MHACTRQGVYPGAQLQPQRDGAPPGNHSSPARALLPQTPNPGGGQYGAALARVTPASVGLGVQRPEREERSVQWPLLPLGQSRPSSTLIPTAQARTPRRQVKGGGQGNPQLLGFSGPGA